ncbi:DUF309 domain-containing protein [Aquibium oceanicum]|uniref:DUF309 domain-containing protein n=1 Tax=Aquibium oceanicum TaxID=1670800 RepID=A0A1L3SUG8_9HYPH|nr:DUF309 domain-containing protein [Aquibium oceanicum]APH73056.1 hypothetical protein BSQ44_18040 [Aquibium oceanicum]
MAQAACPAGDLPLPAAPYIPGRTARPTSGAFMEIADRAPATTDPDLWRDNEAWLCGFTLYRAGFFWETHEVWEPVWMGTRPNSAERQMMQGLIQLANGCLKLAMHRPKAALRLVREAHQRLGDARSGGADRLMGLDPASAHEAIGAFLATADTWPGRGPDEILLGRPQLEINDNAF